MQDYKPHFQKVQRHAYRKVILFAVIAIIATAVIFQFESSETPITTEPAKTPFVIQKLKIPGTDSKTPDSTPAVKTEAPLQITEYESVAASRPEPQNTNVIDIAEPDKAEPPETLSAAATIVASAPVTDTPTMTATWETRVIKSGDSLANIFKEWKLSPTTLHKIVTSSKLAKTLADIHPGETLKLMRDDDDSLLELMVVRNPTETLLITKTDKGFESEKIIREVEVRHAYASGTIETSLFIDGQNSGLTDAQIMEMAGIFGWDIDFALELRKGDSFKLLYEEHFLDGKKYRNGPILTAEFHNNQKTFKAVRYTTPDNITSYYDPDDGRNKKRAFIRTPVKFARISSRFTNKRFHPKLKKWRAHRGVDYAAPTGTPIKAAGKGKVTFRGKKGGYGKTVMIQHGTKYTTLYAHLSKYSKNSRKGKTVSQGQVIGYVGKTGLATGPHLHYEFRVNGVHRNPLTVKLPKADPISKKYRQDFNAKSTELIATFKRFAGNEQQIAKTEDTPKDG
ncbi:MAG: peptidoglycan DD-metalloendopeptidase family protein [Gammaproteobacteria bacterium]|nr:peptidoglycan DD-metalloendopeptidase family protein [Gammaproteobacteria bacterium]